MASVSFKYPAYNPRRFSQPWGAVVWFNEMSRSEYDFSKGTFVGTAEEGGRVIITCKRGDIIATGQKDWRRGKGYNTFNDWYIVGEDGELTKVSQVEALDHFNERMEVPQ